MELERLAEWFPVLLQQTLYNGIHAGDFLTVEDVRRVKEELRRLDGYECEDPKNQAFINAFSRKMSELIECALALNKPTGRTHPISHSSIWVSINSHQQARDRLVVHSHADRRLRQVFEPQA
jgi:hypothetical protein